MGTLDEGADKKKNFHRQLVLVSSLSVILKYDNYTKFLFLLPVSTLPSHSTHSTIGLEDQWQGRATDGR